MLVRCREPGNPLRDEFWNLFAGNNPAFIGCTDAAVDRRGSFRVYFNFFLGTNHQVGLRLRHTLRVAPKGRGCNRKSYLIQDEPGMEVSFSYKMSLERRQFGMLGVDRQ